MSHKTSINLRVYKIDMQNKFKIKLGTSKHVTYEDM